MVQVEINRRVKYKPKNDNPMSLPPEEVVFAEIEIESDGERYFIYSEWREPNQTALNPDSSVSKISRFDIEAKIEKKRKSGRIAKRSRIEFAISADPKY